MRSLFTLLRIFLLLQTGHAHMPTVYEFCSHVVEQRGVHLPSCDAAVCKGRPGKMGPNGPKGDTGSKGEKGDACNPTPCERQLASMALHCSLGIKFHDVQDYAMTASSDGKLHRAYFGRLDAQPNAHSYGSWCAMDNAGPGWIQVDLGKPKFVAGIMTQGRPYSNDWVTSFEVACGSSQQQLTTIAENGINKVFLGNSDANTKISNMFPTSLSCRYVRIFPKTWNNKSCMRIELITGNCHGRKSYRFQIKSAGYDDGNTYELRVNGIDVNKINYNRGHNILVINSRTLTSETRAFDTYESTKAVKNMISCLKEVPYGSLIAMAVRDATTSSRMDDADKAFMSSLGAGGEDCPIEIAPRDSWAFLTQKVMPGTKFPEWKNCSHTPRHEGIAEIKSSVILERFAGLEHIDTT
uniref:uncharacterized protein LOC120341046 n=1 Tax=Styela clava TaxID=7725 RepID=UPI00193A27AB|nr:uncharacterized protein LOC120341046 [Styela clava]